MKETLVFRILIAPLTLAALALTLTGSLSAQYAATTLDTLLPGSGPSGLIMDQAGSLYGTTMAQGSCGSVGGCGTVFQLSPSSGGWTKTIIYSSTFLGGTLGAPLTIDPFGNLYGALTGGGNASPKYCGVGCGIVFELSPRSGGWTFNVLFRFHGSDGGNITSPLTLDRAGNLYGTTINGGKYGFGTVFKLTPTAQGWQHKALHFFTNGADGEYPTNSPLTLDALGNIYGVTPFGGTSNVGTAFKLTPNASGVYRFQYIHTFTGTHDDNNPSGSLVVDASGNIYGAAGGIIDELAYNGTGYVEKVLHKFVPAIDGGNAQWGVVSDSDGNLFGTTFNGKVAGAVFELIPASTVPWPETVLYAGSMSSLHGFRKGVLRDSLGNLYGTALDGAGNDVIYQLSPPVR